MAVFIINLSTNVFSVLTRDYYSKDCASLTDRITLIIEHYIRKRQISTKSIFSDVFFVKFFFAKFSQKMCCCETFCQIPSNIFSSEEIFSFDFFVKSCHFFSIFFFHFVKLGQSIFFRAFFCQITRKDFFWF